MLSLFAYLALTSQVIFYQDVSSLDFSPTF